MEFSELSYLGLNYCIKNFIYQKIIIKLTKKNKSKITFL